MEGLLIAEQLRELTPLLPAARRAWRFPDEHTAVLPLAGETSLWLSLRPPSPRFELRRAAADPTRRAQESSGRAEARETAAHTPFQEQLAARATGTLVAASQPALDRVVRFEFAASDGFVPEPATSLVAELTGRNANLVLLDEDDKILGVQRVILAERNRYRELRPGIDYVPPPPYDKLDPLGASEAELAAALRGRSLSEVRNVIDGIGPVLLAALRSQAELRDEEALSGDRLALVVESLRRLAAEPSAAVAATGGTADVERSLRERRTLELRTAVEAALARRRTLLRRRVADAEHAAAAADDAERLRHEADLLLANAAAFTVEGSAARLLAYDGSQTTLEVDPRLDAAGNAAARYDRAKRREARAARARQQLPRLREELEAVERAASEVATADASRLRELSAEWVDQDGAGGGSGALGGSAAGAKARDKQGGRGRARAVPGVRFVDPRGYEVYVGRNSRENDAITFKLARSLDLWLHVQGYRGAHVVVRSQGRELPFDTVLFAARLAAGFSQARDSDNVPVDYTLRKHVWRQKGAPAGAVNFAQQKTVYVTPARDDEGAAGLSKS